MSEAMIIAVALLCQVNADKVNTNLSRTAGMHRHQEIQRQCFIETSVLLEASLLKARKAELTKIKGKVAK